MNIAIRFFVGYFLIVGLAAWFVLNIFAREVEPGVRQATEDTLVDAANLLAELAAPELAAMAKARSVGVSAPATVPSDGAGGAFSSGRFATAVEAARRRSPGARIYEVNKASVDFRVYLTDAAGRVVFDSENLAVGADYSQWRDVARALRGEYGARSTRDDPADAGSSVLYVAAPVIADGERIGVLSLAKPASSVDPYAEQARDRVLRAGVVLLGVSAAIGLLFTLWLTWSLNRLRDYARAVADGAKAVPPTGGGRQLSELARALARMRERLDGKQYVERYVQSLAHEMKSPLTAVRGAAEVLQDAAAEADRARFVRHIDEQAERMQQIIDRLLALARIEQLQAPEAQADSAVAELVRQVADSRAQALQARGLVLRTEGPPGARLQGDLFLLQQALGNLVDNAIAFSPEGGELLVSWREAGEQLEIAVRDHGPGAPDYALPQLFERFYSLPRPATGRKSTGLGLAFVREVARIHGGEADFANAPGGGALARMLLRR